MTVEVVNDKTLNLDFVFIFLSTVAKAVRIGVIHKVRTFRFRNFRPLSPLYVLIGLYSNPLPPPPLERAFTEFAFFNCTGEMEMDNFGYLNSLLSLFYFYFVTNMRKKLWCTCLYSWTSSLPVRASALSAGPLLLPARVRTSWMTPYCLYD